jgi:competence protein ComEA
MDRLKGLLLALGLCFLTFGVFAADPIDINSATAEQIVGAKLSGIGKAKAAAIVEEREKNGPFKSVEDLKRVKGIKEATISKNKGKISVGAAAPAAAEPTKTPAPVPATPPPK